MKPQKNVLYRILEDFYLLCVPEGEALRRIRASMGGFVRKARTALDDEPTQKGKILRLLALVYDDWRFHCNRNSYFYGRSLYLPYVLEARSSHPMVLGAMVLYLAEKLALPLFAVDFSVQFLLRAETDGEILFIDPWNGTLLSDADLNRLYEGAWGFGAKWDDVELQRAESGVCAARLHQLIKNTLIREEKNELALTYINRLLENGDADPEHFRDRGFALAQMGAYRAALQDFTLFIKKCPHEPTALMLKLELPQLQAEIQQDSISLH